MPTPNPQQNITNHSTQHTSTPNTTVISNQNRQSAPIQTKEIGTECPPIQTDMLTNLSKYIESEIEKAIQNPSPDIKIISSTIPRATVICSKPLTHLLNSISSTMDSVHSSNNKDLLADLMTSIHEFSTALDLIQAKIDND